MSDEINKDCEVEVTSEEEGFRGAWYSAILLDNPTKSGRVKLHVRYMALLEADGSSPLIETVDQGHILTLPPKDRYDGVVFEEGLVVDAHLKDGWWTGLIIQKLEDHNKFLVYFDSPPDIILFDIKQLRPHFHWTGWIWAGPDIKELDKSMFSAGTMVEMNSSTCKQDVAWFPAMMIKEIQVDDEKKFIVKGCNKRCDEDSPNTIIDVCRVRPTPLSSSREAYTLLDCVEAFRSGSGWRRGLVRGILSGKRYMVSIEATKEEYVFNHSDLRPFKMWEDGVWLDGPKQKTVNETPSNVIKKKPTRSSPGAKPMTPQKHTRRSLNPEGNDEILAKAGTEAATRELRKERAEAVTNNKTHPVITPQVTSIAKESISHVTPSLIINATTLRRTEAETTGKENLEKTIELVNDQNGFENDSTQQKMLEEENSKDTNRKRKREEKENSSLKESGTSKNISVDDDDRSLSAQIGNLSSGGGGHTYGFAFCKEVTVLEEIRANEEYKIVPQSPHFSPLVDVKEDMREWSAVGMMVTFYGLLEEVKDLHVDDSPSRVSKLSSSFAELEKHGFDVAMPQSRINKVVCLQDGRAKKAEERKCLEKKIEAEKSEKHKIEEALAELQGKIMELKEKKGATQKRIVEMKTCAETTDEEIERMALEFHTIVSAPW